MQRHGKDEQIQDKYINDPSTKHDMINAGFLCCEKHVLTVLIVCILQA
jgi:hypothetical protein